MSDRSFQLKLADEYYAKKDYDQFEKHLTKIIHSGKQKSLEFYDLNTRLEHQTEDELKVVDDAIMKLAAHFVKEKYRS